jgi:hypothetical protein
MAAAMAALALSLIGGRTANNTLSNNRNDMLRLAQQNPLSFQSGAGSLIGGPGGGVFTASAGQAAQDQALQDAISQQLGGGGLFNQPDFQQALGQNNLSGALGDQNAALQQLFQGQGGLGGAIGSAGGAFGDFTSRAQGGVQDLTGQQAGLFGQGQNFFGQGQNFLGAGTGLTNQAQGGFGQAQGIFGNAQGLFNQAANTSGLVQQNLDASRALAAPFEQRQQQAAQESIFGRTRGATTGGRQEFADILNSQNMADQQRIQNAQQLGLQEQNQIGALGQGLGQIGFGFNANASGLGNLGAGLQQTGIGLNQQGLGAIGAGTDIFGNNIAAQGQNIQGAGMFGNLLQSLQGSQFGQDLGAAQFNQGSGQQRLQNAMAMFGLGNTQANTGFQNALRGIGAQQGQQGLINSLFLGAQNADANRINAQGQFSNALSNTAVNQADNQQGFFGGLISGLFSDERLKENIKRIGSYGDISWYEWDWNDRAQAMGISDQPNHGVLAQEVLKRYPDAVIMTATGFMQVNYRALQRML